MVSTEVGEEDDWFQPSEEGEGMERDCSAEENSNDVEGDGGEVEECSPSYQQAKRYEAIFVDVFTHTPHYLSLPFHKQLKSRLRSKWIVVVNCSAR